MDEIPAITPRSTKRSPERIYAHRARMVGKGYDRQRRGGQRDRLVYKADFRRVFGLGSIAGANRHTHLPHENAREIMRNIMTIMERRAFAAALRLQIEERIAA